MNFERTISRVVKGLSNINNGAQMIEKNKYYLFKPKIQEGSTKLQKTVLYIKNHSWQGLRWLNNLKLFILDVDTEKITIREPLSNEVRIVNISEIEQDYIPEEVVGRACLELEIDDIVNDKNSPSSRIRAHNVWEYVYQRGILKEMQANQININLLGISLTPRLGIESILGGLMFLFGVINYAAIKPIQIIVPIIGMIIPATPIQPTPSILIAFTGLIVFWIGNKTTEKTDEYLKELNYRIGKYTPKQN